MHASASYKRVVYDSRSICFTYKARGIVEESSWNFPHLQQSDCYTVNLPISASIGNECVKGPCQDTIAALWACNVRPSIGTHWTIAALEGKNITMLMSGQSLTALRNEYRHGLQY